MKYSDPLVARLARALLGAFPRGDGLGFVAAEASMLAQWNSVNARMNLDDAVLSLVEQARARERLVALAQAALEQNGKHPALKDVARELEPFQELRGLGLTLKEEGFESVLFEGLDYENPGDWMSKFARIRRCVCRIEPQPRGESLVGYASGFLIAPDLVITNCHVAQRFWKKGDLADRVVVRFGCEMVGPLVSEGEEYRLERDWTLPASPVAELDFAILRLKERAADVEVEGEKRGYLELSSGEEIAPRPLIVLQHPKAEPLKMAFGILRKIESPYMTYELNTEPGSSGGPCLTQDLRVIGLHQRGRSEHGEKVNSGVWAAAFWSKIAPEIEKSKRRASRIPDSDALEDASKEAILSLPAKPTRSGPRKKAFVVQAVGAEESVERQRAERVFNELIEPACSEAGYEAVRAHTLNTATLTKPIVSALFTDPLVVADLGVPPWNANVMLEVGFRLATGRSIVFLADKRAESVPPPLQLRDARIHFVDSGVPRDSQSVLRESILKCRPIAHEQAWESQYAIIDFRLSHREPGESVVTYANLAAAEIYGFPTVDDLIGRPLAGVEELLNKAIPQIHREKYLRDQLAMEGAINKWMATKKETAEAAGEKNDHASGHRETALKAVAEYPLWFRGHNVPAQNGRVYLPILGLHKYDRAKDAVMMRVFFMDVTEWVTQDPGTRPISDVLELPSIFREVTKYKYDFCLCYDSNDLSAANALIDKLKQLEFSVWPRSRMEPEEDQDISSAEAIGALLKSRIVVVLTGKTGIGRWGNGEWDDALYKYCSASRPLACVRVHPKWRGFVASKYHDILGECVYLKLSQLDEQIAPLAAGLIRMLRNLLQQ
jgi:S1-C subfamily serine protease